MRRERERELDMAERGNERVEGESRNAFIIEKLGEGGRDRVQAAANLPRRPACLFK